MAEKKPVLIDQFGAKRAALGLVEIMIDDVRGQRHAFSLLPSRVRAIGDFILRYAVGNDALELSWAASVPKSPAEKVVLARVHTVARSQSAGYAVYLDQVERCVVLAVKEGDGSAADVVMTPQDARQLIERLQVALATIESGDATKQ